MRRQQPQNNPWISRFIMTMIAIAGIATAISMLQYLISMSGRQNNALSNRRDSSKPSTSLGDYYHSRESQPSPFWSQSSNTYESDGRFHAEHEKTIYPLVVNEINELQKTEGYTWANIDIYFHPGSKSKELIYIREPLGISVPVTVFKDIYTGSGFNTQRAAFKAFQTDLREKLWQNHLKTQYETYVPTKQRQALESAGISPEGGYYLPSSDPLSMYNGILAKNTFGKDDARTLFYATHSERIKKALDAGHQRLLKIARSDDANEIRGYKLLLQGYYAPDKALLHNSKNNKLLALAKEYELSGELSVEEQQLPPLRQEALSLYRRNAFIERLPKKLTNLIFSERNDLKVEERNLKINDGMSHTSLFDDIDDFMPPTHASQAFQPRNRY